LQTAAVEHAGNMKLDWVRVPGKQLACGFTDRLADPRKILPLGEYRRDHKVCQVLLVKSYRLGLGSGVDPVGIGDRVKKNDHARVTDNTQITENGSATHVEMISKLPAIKSWA
tara:strand:+ start:1182 stop:1520 length:339 start_codon:yes stop_codon:yes gene_type:complete